MKITTKDHRSASYAMENIKTYVRPKPQFIGSGAKALYRAEERRNVALKACREEYMKLADIPKSKEWKQAVPQVLFDILYNYDIAASLIAAEALLELHGYKFERPVFEKDDDAQRAA